MTYCFSPRYQNGRFDKIVFDDVAKPWFKKYDAEWREDLKVGDTIEIEYTDGKMTAWRSGLIKSADGDELTILLPQLGIKLVKDRWSSVIAEGGKHSRFDEEWRKRCLDDTSLSGFKVQCLGVYKWYEATILKTDKIVREDCEVLMAHVGFRVYRAQGEIREETEDGELIRWDGLGECYDE